MGKRVVEEGRGKYAGHEEPEGAAEREAHAAAHDGLRGAGFHARLHHLYGCLLLLAGAGLGAASAAHGGQALERHGSEFGGGMGRDEVLGFGDRNLLAGKDIAKARFPNRG